MLTPEVGVCSSHPPFLYLQTIVFLPPAVYLISSEVGNQITLNYKVIKGRLKSCLSKPAPQHGARNNAVLSPKRCTHQEDQEDACNRRSRCLLVKQSHYWRRLSCRFWLKSRLSLPNHDTAPPLTVARQTELQLRCECDVHRWSMNPPLQPALIITDCICVWVEPFHRRRGAFLSFPAQTEGK